MELVRDANKKLRWVRKEDDVEDSRETEHEDQEEDSYSFHSRPDNLYASIPDDLEENRRLLFL